MTADARVAGGILWIDVGAVVANWRALAARVRPAECAAVVKADAYGLGIERMVPSLWAAGCRTFFVADLDEGTAVARLLDDAGADPVAARDRPVVYVFNGPFPGSEADFLVHGLQPVLNSLADIDRWSAHAACCERPLAAALHIDTGMARLGLPRQELAELAADPARLRGLQITLILSHLACADTPAHPLNAHQLALFRQAVAGLPLGTGVPRQFGRHLYRCALPRAAGPPGHRPLRRRAFHRPFATNPMQAVVRLDGRILQVREIDAGDTVGYGAAHKSARRARIATVAVGYADGFLRSLSNRGTGYVGEQAVPLVGRVSMDLVTFDVTDVPEPLARPGGFHRVDRPASPDRCRRERGRHHFLRDSDRTRPPLPSGLHERR